MKHMVTLGNGLLLTPYHPVCIDNKWKFPVHLKPSSIHQLDSVFNFVLNKNHIMIINDIECITLGHGKTDESGVLDHAFFGTEKIIQELCRISPLGWAEGYVIVADNEWEWVRSSGENGIIDSLQPI
eukprot:Pgem_evm1s14247